MLLKVVGVGICSVIVNLILKQYKPEFALVSNVCGGLIIFAIVANGSSELLDNFYELQGVSGLDIDIVKPIMKVLGIGYITEFTSNIAEDCGNKSIASKITLGGKIAICALAFPILKQLINAILLLI